MTKIAAGFAVLVLSVSGMALASGTPSVPAVGSAAPVKASASTPAPVGATQQAPVQVAAPATSTETKSAAPLAKPTTPEAGKADVKPEIKSDATGVKKTDEKVIQGAVTTPAPKTTTN